MKPAPLYIVGRGMVTPAAGDTAGTWRALRDGAPRFAWDERYGPVGALAPDAETAVAALARDKRWRSYDRAALLGVLAAREAWYDADGGERAEAAVVMGSSRGATMTLEREHDRFLAGQRIAATTSPMSTMGTFAAAVSQALATGGPAFTVSSACSTSLNAIGTAAALIIAGQADTAIAGGAEASLTGFTLAQLAATSVLAKRRSALFPCRPMHPERDGLVPGEGAACVVLTTAPRVAPLAEVLGYGAAVESATATGISADGGVLATAMARALAQAQLPPASVDLIVGHGAGTVKGDLAEQGAYRRLFGAAVPPRTFHKWLTGHMLGAAAACSVALACQHLAEGEVPPMPYWEPGMEAYTGPGGDDVRSIDARIVLVTALGFGGNAAALVLARPR